MDRVEGAAQERLSELNLRRQELLVKYYEDAPQIKQIDEDTKRIQKSLGAFRSRRTDSSAAVIVVKFVD